MPRSTPHPRRASSRAPVALFAVMFLMVAGTLRPATAAKPAKPPRTGGLSGVVAGSAGVGLASAKVTAYALPGSAAGCPQAENDWKPVATTTSATDGRFSLALSPGTYRVGVTPNDLWADSFGYWVASVQSDGSNVTNWVGYADDVLVPTSGLNDLRVQVTTPAHVSGRVVDDGSSPLPIAGVNVRAVPEQYAQTATNAAAATTDASGRYEILGLPTNVPAHEVRGVNGQDAAIAVDAATRYGLVFSDPTGWHGPWFWWFGPYSPFGELRPPVVDVTAADTLTPDDVVLERTGRVNGKVVDERGRAIAGIEVAPTTAFESVPTVTDARGRFVTPLGTGNPDGPQTIRFTDPQGRYQDAFYPGVQYLFEVTIPPLGTPVGTELPLTMKLRSGASRVTGFAWYSAGVPAAGAIVRAYSPAAYGVDLGASSSAEVACDGRFTVNGLWPGAYRLGFDPSVPFGGGNTASRILNVTAGQTVDAGTVTMPSWVVSGTVREGSAGSPGPAVEGIQVDLQMQLNVNGQDIGFRALADYGVPWARAISAPDALGVPTGAFSVFLTSWPNGALYVKFHDPRQPARFPDQVYRDYPAENVGALVDLWGSFQYQQQFDTENGSGPVLFDIYLHRAFMRAASSSGNTVTVTYSEGVSCTPDAAPGQWSLQAGPSAVEPTGYSCGGNQVTLTFADPPVPGGVVVHQFDGDEADAVTWTFDPPPFPGSDRWEQLPKTLGVRPFDAVTLDRPVILWVSGAGTPSLTAHFSQDVTCDVSDPARFLHQWQATFQDQNGYRQYTPSGADCNGSEVTLYFDVGIPYGQLNFTPDGTLTSATSPAVLPWSQNAPIGP